MHHVSAGRRYPAGALLAIMLAVSIVITFALLPIPWLQKTYLIASPFCPQRPAHSVFIGGMQMPIEARMFGLFGGALMALLYFAARGQLRATAMPQGWRRILCLALIGMMALDGANAVLFDAGLITLYAPNLYLRLGTGLASGVGLAMILVPLNSQAIWKPSPPAQHLFTNGKDVAGMLVISVVLYIITLSNWAPAFFPLAWLSSLAIITLMTAIFTIMLVAVQGSVGRFTTWRSVLTHYCAGFIAAALFITALAMMRLLVMGPGPIGV